jgi:hypothetical protein
MKKLIFFSLLATSIASCSKVKIEAPDFSVSADQNAYTTKDTITFNFDGNPDYITFYSGETGKRYEYANTTSVNYDSTILYFSTNTTAASATTQPLSANNVSVLASTDFNGSMDSVSIRKANWKDVTSKATFATTTTTVQSGNIHIEDLKTANAPLYIAFRYVSDTAKATYLPRKWTIASFGIKNYFKDVVYYLAGGSNGTTLPFTTGGFYEKSLSNSGSNWVYSNTSLTFNAAAVGSLPDEDWAISRPFDLSLYASDLGTAIKNTSARLSQYKYRFTKAGTYTVTFVAQNANSEKVEQTVRQTTVTINP